jgi:hypothetical protein
VWDLVRLVETPAPAESLWADLASRDAARGRAAIESLVAQGGKAVALLRAPDANQLARWIAELDSDDFDQRQHAEAELARHQEFAVLPLQQALGGKVSLEARRRIQGLLRKHDLGIISPDELRRVRALQALELLGTPEARALARTPRGV